MATEVHSIPAPPTLLERRSGSGLRLFSDLPTLHSSDAPTQSKDEVSRSSRGSSASPFTFTPLTPILASPVLTPAITTATPSTSSANLNTAALPLNSSVGIKHKRSRSTLSRLHVTLPEDYFDARSRAGSTTVPIVPASSLGPSQLSGSPPSPCLLKDIVILNGIPIVKTPSPVHETSSRGVDSPIVSTQASVAPKLPRPWTKSARKSFTLGSDDEDDESGRQQKREAAAKAKKLEKYDDLRRYHALMELLKTEAKYLQDLRILINLWGYTDPFSQVYLQQLHHAVTSRSVASYFGSSASSSKQTPSPSPTFSSTHTQGQSANPPPSPTYTSTSVRRRSVGANDRVETEKDLPFARPIFTEEDIQLLCRNSNEILAFHERFVGDLKEALAPLGSTFRFDNEDEYAYVDMPRHDTLELAIQIIVSIFVDQAQSFKLYKFFCSTHSEAVELVQRTKRVSPADWEAWEKRCRKCVLGNYRCDPQLVSNVGTTVHFELDGGSSPSPQKLSVGRSLTTKNNRSRPSMPSKPLRANTAPPHLMSRHNHHGHGQTPRLEFLDHMIKPVQRICKYHLLLDQLKSRVPGHSHSHRWAEGGSDHSHLDPVANVDGTFDPAELFSAGQTESLVSRACEVMREVVNSVNDDRRKHEDRWKALLIASRTVPSPAASSSSPPHPQLNSDFLMTLGNCLMCGALDVIYHRPTSSTMTKAKYLGAFLYEQDYLVLVKVGKGKTYEPQQWFPLKDFDVLDLNDEDGTFPYSFHLTGYGHHFRFAAACQKEKEVWMEGLRKAIISAAENDPTGLPSSLLDENKEEVAPTTSVTIRDAPTEGLPTIQSETENLEDLLVSRPRITKTMSETKAFSDDGHSIRTDPRPHSQPVSRRGSSNSVRAIFSPFLFDSGIRLARPTAVQRHHTDQGLLDVLSDSCRDARNLAELQNQELFQLPRSITRYKSGVVVSGLRGRKDSKIFNRRSYGGLPAASLSSSPANSTPNTLEKRFRQKKERPSTVMVFPQSWFGEDPTPNSASVLRTPSLMVSSPEEDHTQTALPDVTTSLCSSEVTSNVGSALNSPTGFKTSSLGSPYIHLDTIKTSFKSGPDVDRDYRPKRSKSMVDNVKSFFVSPSKRLSRHPSAGADLLADSLSLARGRTRSSPTSYLHDPLEPSLPSVAVHPVGVDADTPAPDRSYRDSSDQGRDSMSALGRKRSLFAYGKRHGTDVSRLTALSTMSATSSTTETSGSNSPVRRRSVKDILLHFRNS
ncbi:Dbl homology domain-containing protein [Thelephora ganbajun]|uniref:Dbl homology domain-containing protein n=1 Tax=Thelephora ganbajun TaxID=370292 RepID=A0ACB6ZC53_THEGA|nr:Dbl homology domain-containing protein [Thelephora ganbajun]